MTVRRSELAGPELAPVAGSGVLSGSRFQWLVNAAMSVERTLRLQPG
jgi:hypothetical protein